jgi:hypothetical protein
MTLPSFVVIVLLPPPPYILPNVTQCEMRQWFVRCPSVPDWGLGDEAVTALVALLQPCPNLDGSWEVLPSLMELNLTCEWLRCAICNIFNWYIPTPNLLSSTSICPSSVPSTLPNANLEIRPPTPPPLTSFWDDWLQKQQFLGLSDAPSKWSAWFEICSVGGCFALV